MQRTPRPACRPKQECAIDLDRMHAAQTAAMISLPSALARAIGQLSDPAILRVLAKSLAITLAVFALLGGLLWFGLYRALIDQGVAYSAELGTLVAVVVTIVSGWLLFRLVALAVLQFFADEVVHAVEAKHYPSAVSSARTLDWHEELRNTVRSTARVLLVNLIALPFAIALLVTGIGTAILFWVVNGWLLGRELQDMVWLRHRTDEAEKPPISIGTRFALGGIIAVLLTVPFVNLLAPVLGAAAATHLVHRTKRPL